MKTDVVTIDNRGNGFDCVMDTTKKAAVYRRLNAKDTVCLQLLAEEMLSLARSVTGEMQASFWIENEGTGFELHMTTKTVMDKEKRALLISAATAQENDAARTFLGKLRDRFEQAMLAESDRTYDDIPDEILKDIDNAMIEKGEWDGYERSVLRKLADNVKIAIRGGLVEMTVSREFAG